MLIKCKIILIFFKNKKLLKIKNFQNTAKKTAHGKWTTTPPVVLLWLCS